MLKLTYTENNFHLERLSKSLEDWLNLYIWQSLEAAKSIQIKPSAASFLVVADESRWSDLRVLEAEKGKKMEFNRCDAEYREVRLKGTWVSWSENINEGIFVCVLRQKAEIMLEQLWRVSSANKYEKNYCRSDGSRKSRYSY